MPKVHTSVSISRLTLEISEYFDDFKESPHSATDFDALVRNISMELDDDTSWKTKSNDKVFAYEKFVQAHHILAQARAKSSGYSAFIAGKILCSGQWWRRLVKDGETHLLGALLIAGIDNTVDPKTRTAIENTILAWTKSPFDVSRQDGEDLARALFGDAWVTLYADELAQGLGATFKTLLETQPPLVFARGKVLTKAPGELPGDMSFP